MNPPRDPFLRAVWRVCQCADLTPMERIGLLALWRFLGGQKKPVGPTLLAHLVNTSPNNAKGLLWNLRSKGYVKSDGRYPNPGRQPADRWITKKARLPKVPKQGADLQGAGTTAKALNSKQALPVPTGSKRGRLQVAGTTIDLGVDPDPLGRLAPGVGATPDPDTCADVPDTNEVLTPIADIMCKGDGDA